jgi:hypothetical protein
MFLENFEKTSKEKKMSSGIVPGAHLYIEIPVPLQQTHVLKKNTAGRLGQSYQR